MGEPAQSVVELSIEELDASVDEAWKTYRIVAALDASAENLYTIFGSSALPLAVPPAYQVATPFGAHVGGTSPAFWALGAGDSQFDSWLTVGVTEGDSGQLMNIGIDWDTWTIEDGLSVDDGAVFWSEPDNGPSRGSGIVLAQLTIPASVSSFSVQFGLQGKSSAADAPDWSESAQVQLGVVESSGEEPPAEEAPAEEPSAEEPSADEPPSEELPEEEEPSAEESPPEEPSVEPSTEELPSEELPEKEPTPE